MSVATPLDVLSGTFDEQTGYGDDRRWDPLRAPQIARSVRYRVTSQSARVRYAGKLAVNLHGSIRRLD